MRQPGASAHARSAAALDPRPQLPNGTERLFADCRTHLTQAMEWCHRRQNFVQIEKGAYHSKQEPCDVGALLSTALVGVRSEVQVSLVGLEQPARVDEFVLRLILDEALANVRAYSAPNSLIEVQAALVSAADAPPDYADASRAESRVEVASAAVLRAAADGEAAAAVSARFLYVSIDSINCQGLAPLSAEQCKRVFVEGYIAHAVSPTSDGLGLDSIAKARSPPDLPLISTNIP